MTTYVPIEEADATLREAQANILMNVEAALGVMKSSAKEMDAQAAAYGLKGEVDLQVRSESYAKGLYAGVEIMRAVVDAMLANPLRLVAGDTAPIPPPSD